MLVFWCAGGDDVSDGDDESGGNYGCDDERGGDDV